MRRVRHRFTAIRNGVWAEMGVSRACRARASTPRLQQRAARRAGPLLQAVLGDQVEQLGHAHSRLRRRLHEAERTDPARHVLGVATRHQLRFRWPGSKVGLEAHQHHRNAVGEVLGVAVPSGQHGGEAGRGVDRVAD